MQNEKTVYGPVRSWRFGMSLGIDLLFELSTCSFNCVYCQLGHIQQITTERKTYVPTQKVLADFNESLSSNQHFDVITFSGSGEPTLARNLGEVARELKKLKPQIPLLVLTNSTMLALPEVQNDLQFIDRVIVKLDACNDKTLRLMNRPAKGLSFEGIIQSILAFKEVYKGILDVQVMFMPANLSEVRELGSLLKQIKPSVVQLNTPLRPYPTEWNRESRGNHNPNPQYETRKLRVISKDEAKFIEDILRQETALTVLSVYRE